MATVITIHTFVNIISEGQIHLHNHQPTNQQLLSKHKDIQYRLQTKILFSANCFARKAFYLQQVNIKVVEKTVNNTP
jgi:menaquinone-dependent protoporphyrinogen IX oxidase